MTNFGIDSNMVFDANGKSVAARLSDHDVSLDGLSSSLADKANKTDAGFRSILEWGAVADANYYNSSDKKYYKDSAFTILATDNTTTFSNALNSGFNIHIPKGNYYLSSGVTINNGIKVVSNGAKIYIKASSQPIFAFFIKGDFTSIDGLSVNSTLDYSPIISGLPISSGKGSNIIAFQVEANYVYFNNCKTNNCDYGVSKGTMISCNNLYINNCSFENGVIPIFAFYITNMFVSDTYLSCNNTGLTSACHCFYLSDYAKQVMVSNVKMFYPTDVNGDIIHIYSARASTDNTQMMNDITFSDCEIETYGSTLTNAGYTDGLTFKGCKFKAHFPTAEGGSKIMFSYGYLTNVVYKNCIFIIDQANDMVYGSNTESLLFEECLIRLTTMVTTNVLSVLVPSKWIRCSFLIDTFTSGQFLGNNNLSTLSKISFINCLFQCKNGGLIFGNGDFPNQTVVLIGCTVVHNSVSKAYLFYNYGATNTSLLIVSCKLYGYNAICASTTIFTSDNLISGTNVINSYYSQSFTQM
jgi:hypothetical protein